MLSRQSKKSRILLSSIALYRFLISQRSSQDLPLHPRRSMYVTPKPRAEGERVLYGAAHLGLTWLRTLVRPRFVLSLSFVRVVGLSACWLVVARRLVVEVLPPGSFHISSWL